jgi:hypothetical protein
MSSFEQVQYVHVNSLAEKDSKGRIVTVQETQLTGLIAHALVKLVDSSY